MLLGKDTHDYDDRGPRKCVGLMWDAQVPGTLTVIIVDATMLFNTVKFFNYNKAKLLLSSLRSNVCPMIR